MTAGPILLAAIVGASVSFLVALFFNLLHEQHGGRQGAPHARSKENEIWD